MIDNSVIKADFIASLKGNATLIAALTKPDPDVQGQTIGGAENIKESQWAGTDFIFPAVRAKINRQVPITNRQNCDHARLSFSIRVLTEGGSSKQSDEIAGIVSDHFHGDAGGGKFFQGTGWSTYLRGSGLGAAVRTGERLWMSEAFFEGTVYPT